MSTIDSIHELIEQTAQRLQRSVAVDDAGLLLLGSSTHFEDVDEARLSSLVGRKVTGALREHIMEQGLQTWREPTILRARPELGIGCDRLCFPLRSRFELLGFMWIMATGPLGDDEMTIAAEAAAQIQQILVRGAESAVDADLELEALVRAVFSPESSERSRAARELHDLGMFTRCESHVAVLVATDREKPSAYGEIPSDIVRRALDTATAGRSRDERAISVGTTTATLVLGGRADPRLDDARSLAQSTLREIARLDAALARSTVMGIGAPVDRLDAVRHSRDQAAIAVRIARASADPVIAWTEHPADALILGLLKPYADPWLIPAVLREAMDAQSAEMNELLDTFLDLSGNAIATADRLHLHRTTVYYRIRKFQERTGLDLDDGAVRLQIHLWLRLSRLARHAGPDT